MREQIKELIIQRILDGTYKPGDRVVELQLVQELGVSQAPVREALRDLEAMRFIETEPYRGARVREVTPQELNETYPVRAALEELGGQLAVAHADDKTFQLLEAEIAHRQVAAINHDQHELLVHDARFHEIILGTARNTVLLDTWSGLRIEAYTLVSVIKSQLDLGAIAQAHEPIVTALRQRDADLTGKVMREHIEHFGNTLFGGATHA
jgi:DNA-binding GntR family transcriptional regulator